MGEETASDAYNRGFDDGLYMARNRELQVELRAAMRAELLAEVLDLLLDPNGFPEWTWKNGENGVDPRWVSRESRRAVADYLAERFAPTTAPEGADERNGHG